MFIARFIFSNIIGIHLSVSLPLWVENDDVTSSCWDRWFQPRWSQVIDRRGTEACSGPRNGTHKSLNFEGETVPVLLENTDLRAILTPFWGKSMQTFQKRTPFFPEITDYE